MLDKYIKITDATMFLNYKAGYFNAINACEINYGIIDPDVIAFSKAEKQQLKILSMAKSGGN
ncbi:hypothetical protein [Spiroplasma clarkii]|nr:hypothetical protein [Spiroplasma clarkii]